MFSFRKGDIQIQYLEVWWFVEDQGFSPSYNLAPLPLPSPRQQEKYEEHFVIGIKQSGVTFCSLITFKATNE